MPLFGKKGQQPVQQQWFPPPPPPPLQLRGTLPCAHPGCGSTEGVPCSYVDRRRRACGTAWCPEHQVVVAGVCYCRRHAALPGAFLRDELLADRGLPDVENRSPSLANYIGDHIEPRVMQLLWERRRPGSADEVGAEPVHLVRPPDGRRRWDRSWKLFDHTGVITKITVEAEEEDDPMFGIRVGRRLVLKETPPWITRRKSGIELSPEMEAADRQRFYDSLIERLVPALHAELESQI